MPVESVPIRGNVVNERRMGRGLSRMELYRKAGIDPRTGFKAIQGGRVERAVAVKLARALKIPVADIIAEPVEAGR